MASITHVLEVTKQLKRLVEEKVTPNNREHTIAQINELVEKRGEFLQNVHPPFSNEEQQIGKEIVTLNEIIQKQMDVIFNDLKVEMKQMNKQKKSTKTYENPYRTTGTVDGMFLDQRK